ncbi:hypothetical protein FH972_014930 [Carpinus fangiana]|uniref:Uncharacterized protein n=1 Tax=Carpinus fangiana TaxID=176857 RepID=A0A5N6REE9_9ROSI|nr:hypothetical protein FH972_014930 [Carpinus fangiana]
MARDEWVRAAMTDDMMVVELLVGLKQSQAAAAAASSSPSPKSWPRAVVPPRWGLRQPGSRPRCDAVSRKKEGDFTRCSPTTPLSWSGGASPSPTTDGFKASRAFLINQVPELNSIRSTPHPTWPSTASLRRIPAVTKRTGSCRAPPSAIPPRRWPGLDLNWCIIEVCKLSTKKGDSLTFNLSPRVIVGRRRGRGGDSDRTPRRRSSGRTDHEVPLDIEVWTENSEPLMQHDAAVQESLLPGQQRNPRRRGRKVMNMDNSHPAQVLSLPNQRRNRRWRNMNDPINSSTVITTQSTAQPETQLEHRREVINMNNSHPTKVPSLPNQQRHRRRRNMNDPINDSIVITAQSTAQPET